MQLYELIVVLTGTISDTDVSEALGRVEKIVEAAGGTEIRHEEHGKHRLAYPIGANHYGHYVTVYFTAEPTTVVTIQQKLRLTKEVIRFVLEDFVVARHKRPAQIASSPLVRGEKDRDHEERESRGFAESARPVYTGTTSKGEAPVTAAVIEEIKIQEPKEETKSVGLEEIDRKLDELLEGGLSFKI